MICRTFELIEPGGCDQCLPEVFSDAVCVPKNAGSDTYTYEGTVLVPLPPHDVLDYSPCDFTTSEMGFEIVSTTIYPSDLRVIDYIITSTNPHLEEISILLCFNRTDLIQYCVPFTITVKEPCGPSLPENCVRSWIRKQMSCIRSDSDNVVFSLPDMDVPIGSYIICDEGLFGSVEGGTVVVNNASISGGRLLFDVDIIIPSENFVNGGQYDVRLFLCDRDGNLVCYLFPLELRCHSAALSTSNEGEIENFRVNSNKNLIKSGTKDYILQPNPTTDKLIILSPSFDKKREQVIRLQDSMGRLIHESRMAFNKLEINVASFHSGIYFVTILENGSPVATKKIIVLH